MSDKKPVDKSDRSWWGATKSFFKIVDNGLSTSANAAEAMLSESANKQKAVHFSKRIKLIKKMGIYNADGSVINDAKVIQTIFDSCKKDRDCAQRIYKLAQKLDLDATEYIEILKKSNEVKEKLSKISF
jgi:hypothetical protein